MIKLNVFIMLCVLVLTMQVPPLYSVVTAGSTMNLNKYQNLNANQLINLECKQVDDDQQIYLCTQKMYGWVLDYLDADLIQNKTTHVKTNQIQIELQADDQIKQKIRKDMANIVLIQANVQQHQKVVLQYLKMSQPTVNDFKFTNITIPQVLKGAETQIPTLVMQQINRQFGHKKSSFFEYIVIVIIVIVVIVVAIYFWRRKQISSKIQQPADLKQVMMVKLDRQKDEQRSANSTGVVRSSEPPPKIHS